MISTQAPAKVRAAAREEQCLKLRLAGLTHRAIAAQLSIAPSTAYKRVRHALDGVNQRTTQEAESLRALELARLDELQCALWEQALAGELKAVDRVLKVMERRAKLLGLDAPLAVVTDDTIHIKIIELDSQS